MWRYVQIVLLLVAFLAGLNSPSVSAHPAATISWFQLLLGCLVGPLFEVLLLWFYSQRATANWLQPSLNENPLKSSSQPLVSSYFAGLLFMALGGGSLLASAFSERPIVPETAIFAVIGFVAIVGVHLFMHLFPTRVAR